MFHSSRKRYDVLADAFYWQEIRDLFGKYAPEQRIAGPLTVARRVTIHNATVVCEVLRRHGIPADYIEHQ